MSPHRRGPWLPPPVSFRKRTTLTRPRRLPSYRSRGARARARFVSVGTDLAIRAFLVLCVWYRLRSSLVAPLRFRGGGRLEIALETERATAFPRGPAGACLARRFTRARARRARPPPFAPRGAPSPACASRRGFSFELGRYLSRDAPRPLSRSRCSRMMLQGDPACCAGSTGYAWGATRRRPRSIRPMSAAHGFSFQR